jgi:hypothetical protein
MKQGGPGSIAPCLLNLGIRWEWSASGQGCLDLGETAPGIFRQEVGWTPMTVSTL